MSAATFANSLNLDQARHNVGPDLDPSSLTLWWYSWKNLSKQLFFEKISRRQKRMQNYPAGKQLIGQWIMKIFKGWSLIKAMKVNPEAVYRLIETKKSSTPKYCWSIFLHHLFILLHIFILSNSYSIQHQDSRHKNGIYQQRMQLRWHTVHQR